MQAKVSVYDFRERMEDILKMHGGMEFFREMNAGGIPFFFAAATANSQDGTEYKCETITPNAMGIRLKDDKFADFLNIRNSGFVAIPKSDLTSESARALKMLEENGTDGISYGDALRNMELKGGVCLPEGDAMGISIDADPDDDGGDMGLLMQSIMDSAIADAPDARKEERKMPAIEYTEYIPSWDDSGEADLKEAFARVDQRDVHIPKGDGLLIMARQRRIAAEEAMGAGAADAVIMTAAPEEDTE